MNATASKYMPTKAPIVFLVAKERSGTTLLQTMLDSHPNISAPFESRFVLHFMNKYQKKRLWDKKLKAQFVSDLLQEQKIELLWELDVDGLTNRIAKLPENTSYGDVCKQVYVSAKSFHKKEKTLLIVDKNPIYAIMIPLLQEIYPSAKFIHLVRDYRANVNSIRSLSPSAGVKQLGLAWVMTNLEIEKSKKAFSKNFITLRYEDLLDAPQKSLERLLQFFNLEFHPDMLTYHERIAQEIPAYIDRSPNEKIRKMREMGIAVVHKNLSKPLDPSLQDRWKETLTHKELQTLEKFCGGFAEKYDYFFTTAIFHKNEIIPLGLRLERDKLRLYYQLPIWLRELKSKPSMPFIPKA